MSSVESYLFSSMFTIPVDIIRTRLMNEGYMVGIDVGVAWSDAREQS